MIKIFIPETKGKQKTNIRGFWKSPSGKIYYDYLVIKQSYIINNDVCDNLKRKYNQAAIFYIEDGRAYIFNNSKDVQELSTRHCEIIPKNKGNLKQNIKRFLKLYGGVTVYIKGSFYVIETWN